MLRIYRKKEERKQGSALLRKYRKKKEGKKEFSEFISEMGERKRDVAQERASK